MSEDPEVQEEFGKAIYETVACMIYDMLDHKRHYKAFIENLKLTKIPPPFTELPPATPQHTDRASK